MESRASINALQVEAIAGEIPVNRYNINAIGNSNRNVIMAHGFGCDQNIWRFRANTLQKDYRIVLFDFTGSGKSDASQDNIKKCCSLEGYVKDLIKVCLSLNLKNSLFVGHFLTAITGLIASLKERSLFGDLVTASHSPCFFTLSKITLVASNAPISKYCWP